MRPVHRVTYFYPRPWGTTYELYARSHDKKMGIRFDVFDDEARRFVAGPRAFLEMVHARAEEELARAIAKIALTVTGSE